MRRSIKTPRRGIAVVLEEDVYAGTLTESAGMVHSNLVT